jgi:hypothetical protein
MIAEDSPTACKEALRLLCGEHLGGGMSREVYACALMPEYVVKVETDARRFQNVMEWEVWQRVKDTPASRWFAECRWISPSGVVLIMERTRVPGPKDYPSKVPVWFTDLKRQNWGMAKSNKSGKEFLVCHDYGTSLVIENGTTTKRVKKAEWWDANG